ncbi:MAG: DNA topoisomerase I [Candidatus Yanofskybacteria bacterium RIFOXYD1_FULL_44_17]|uniref:DNA topoisomerase 1 n=1 Tax=Candidatus Yanofskybacteria bacterium GW2011_GWE2_40_11 TaxID=1619033 RepID=A0A0G0T1A5_9BACT|nr:MAG: topoisomerase I protein [Candidatus Yanofskybacteria bacterium GW2011_GWE1_40_10]KKR40895.1 MAG: topoisomerase I protein [Candidatus Yanofskybacteria bacterium GW2011_GWE2_40_11]OGN35407.1 MAG: DNA topoisomerase I [Candidatus Yanofskybacteria bacterium RIFOXYA1_FULL_44_17]OGN36504.1 MAG: DNA topoisomerase I [Candidatus Yanofskybacteria bacterium RIFOXYA2_FULL_45_28]OGN37154.1 MAG: DNA topoisomerase I [Candidatus Yanofskybacteria bacterium RIFOXYC1_FULL_44_16]OGN37640.1 MAG: DNA topoiso
MNLVIVESPTKAKTISRFLGGDFIVKSSYGHVRDLPKGDLGIDLENDFEPKYVIPTKARKNVSELKKLAEKADEIILATDEDREGEAISWHLVEALGIKKLKKADKDLKIQRIVFHEITKRAIEEALKNPREIDQNLVDAQQARRILDRIVGYKLSPFLWKKVARGLSAGRVQSVAVRLVVEREREIEKFKAEEYWDITAKLKSDSQEFDATLNKIDGKTVDKFEIKNETEAKRILSDLDGKKYVIDAIEKNETTRAPMAPFTTSTLQQDAARKLHFSAKQTMMIAQKLYEGIELGGDGSVGLITYMRTDSVNLSEESLTGAQEYITKTLGEQYYERKTYQTKSKSAQEAHEAVRPTEPNRSPESIKDHLSAQEYKLYNLIWRRFIASQMPKAVFDATAIDIKADKYNFRSNGSTIKFDGFLKIYPIKIAENTLPVVKDGQEVDLINLTPEQHFTKPPARYNEASLIKTLEKEGIGRPSTYAPTISTIIARNYVNKDPNRYFHPTEIGTLVNDVLVAHFPEIVDMHFTSKMEDNLDSIANGDIKWVPTLREFYDPFAKNLKDKYEEVTKEEVTNIEDAGVDCDKCGSKMIYKMGRFGRFVACSNFPACKNILKEKKDKEPEEKTGEVCDKCSSEMVFRKGRFGKFIACSNYPKCKNTKKIMRNPALEKADKAAEKEDKDKAWEAPDEKED